MAAQRLIVVMGVSAAGKSSVVVSFDTFGIKLQELAKVLNRSFVVSYSSLFHSLAIENLKQILLVAKPLCSLLSLGNDA